jgi:hypothetical protein
MFLKLEKWSIKQGSHNNISNWKKDIYWFTHYSIWSANGAENEEDNST